VDFFNEDGHISQFGFEKIIKGTASELERLEFSEHIDFCEKCFNKYLEEVEKNELIPYKSVKQEVFAKTVGKKKKIQVDRYFRFAVAASFTMVLWFSGAFNASWAQRDVYNQDVFDRKSEKIVKISDDFFSDVNKFFDFDNLKGEIINGKK
jgi:hypothetical protein